MTQCDWEKGDWPVKKGDEIDSAFFEDIRRRLWLLIHQNAGHVDLVRKYGKYIDNPPGAGYSTEYTYTNWEGSFPFPPENPADPGEVIVIFKDGDITDLFINNEEMEGDDFDVHPPLDETTGMIDSNWCLYPNPNLYCHYNQNAGRVVETGADNRYIINHRSFTGSYCGSPPENVCDPPFQPYDLRLPASKFLPQQTSPDKQIPFLKIAPIETKYEYYNTGDNDGLLICSTTWGFQTFTTLSSHKVNKAELKLYRNGSPGTVIVSIRATDMNGHPTGGDLCYGSFDGNTLAAYPGEWKEITFASEITLDGAAKYALVVRNLYGDGVNYITWRFNTQGTYAEGNLGYSEDGGNTWISENDYDFMFEIWYVSAEQTVSRKSPVEILKKYITQVLPTQYERSYGPSCEHDPCIYPRHLTEYIKEGGEPRDNAIEEALQYAYEPKMCEAYQDRVQLALEEAMQFLKHVDEDWIAVWSWNMSKNAPEWLPSPQDYYKGQVVKHGGIYYIAIVTNTGQEPPNTNYWLTPVYQPEYFRDHPIYEFMYEPILDKYDGCTPLWGCNSSIFELVLKNIVPGDSSIPYDWYWDTSYPFVPSWLKFAYEAEYPNNQNSPLPRGCWRRTWRHSMGRVSNMMWPGEMGLPPGYGDNPIEASKFIITQTEYNEITDEDKKKNYKVVDVEGLYESAYGDEEEALIAERHDSVAIHKYKIVNPSPPPEYLWHEQPLYEIHHDLVNDLRNALIQLYIINQTGIGITTYIREKEAYRGGGQAPVYDTPDEAYLAGCAACDASANEDTLIVTPDVWMGIGYEGRCRGPCETYPPPSSPKYAGCMGYCMSGYGSLRYTFLLRIIRAVELNLNLTEAIVRVGYKGQPLNGNNKDGCEAGFEDLTIIAAPGAAEKCAYLKLSLNSGSGYWQYYAGYGWYYICDYVAFLISNWPDNPWIPAEQEQWFRQTMIDACGEDMDKFCVFEIDWCSVPESVFEEDPTNYIEV